MKLRLISAIFCLLIFVSSQGHAQIFEFIGGAASWLSKGTAEARDALWKDSMLLNSVKSLAELQKNYDSAKKLEAEIEMIRKDPGVIKRTADNNYHPKTLEESYREQFNKAYDKAPDYLDQGEKDALDYFKSKTAFTPEAKAEIDRKIRERKRIKDEMGDEKKTKGAQSDCLYNTYVYTEEMAAALKELLTLQRNMFDSQQESSREQKANIYKARLELAAGMKKIYERDKMIKKYSDEKTKMVEEIPEFQKQKAPKKE